MSEVAMARMQNELSKEIINLHNKHGYQYTEYFNWLIDDVLAGFGVSQRSIPPDECRDIIFNLASQYADLVIHDLPFQDILGNVYMDLVSNYGQKALGQYFTPAPVARMMAEMQFSEESFKKDGLVTVCDPACGSGVMLLSFVQVALGKLEVEDIRKISLTGIDLDITCARIFACQLLANMFVHQIDLGEILVYQGNALGDPALLQCLAHATCRDLPHEWLVPSNNENRLEAISEAARSQQVGDQLALFEEV